MQQESARQARLARQPGPRRSRGLLVAAYLLLTAAVLADLLTGPQTTVSPVLASVPVLAGSGTRSVRVPLIAGALAAVAAALLSLVNPDVATAVHVAALAAIVSVTLASAANVVVVAAREHELRQVRSVAEAAQRALLRPVPPRVGPLRIAVRYAAAAAEARIGGDLYEVLDTRYGVRVLLGDVEGKGLGAVDTAADVLGVFREAARTEADLARVAERLDAALARRPEGGRFVTAVLVGTEPPGSGGADGALAGEVVNCGHPAPLLLDRAGRVRALEPASYAPPLGLLALTGGRYRAERLSLRRGDLLLLYTDGLSESRDADGRFYPVAERLAEAPALGPEALLDHLLADVRQYSDGSPTDDSALLAVRRES
ncbi:PP2C family protein-serine/threonine phosphatase [Kitasatospora kazusensis]|uniref:PP2C family protein-serine/threonine phosphatase n=1 Tax=Kitasatospora kazusensis TaxID=407974 RepID=A0ABN2ZS02_9ACTN